MNVEMIYAQLKSMVNIYGWDAVMKLLDEKYGFDFYSISKDWYEDRSFGCKLKGAKGDLIIHWKEEAQ
jgi:hypothetical protein